jgi:hypothetical protein
MFTVCHTEEAELLPPQLLPRCPVYDRSNLNLLPTWLICHIGFENLLAFLYMKLVKLRRFLAPSIFVRSRRERVHSFSARQDLFKNAIKTTIWPLERKQKLNIRHSLTNLVVETVNLDFLSFQWQFCKSCNWPSHQLVEKRPKNHFLRSNCQKVGQWWRR